MKNLTILLFLMVISIAQAEQKTIVGYWQTADKKVVLQLWDDKEAGYNRGTLGGNGSWEIEKEGKFEGCVKVSLNSDKRTKYVLYFQPAGRKLLGVNTLTVDGVFVPDDTLLFNPNPWFSSPDR